MAKARATAAEEKGRGMNAASSGRRSQRKRTPANQDNGVTGPAKKGVVKKKQFVKVSGYKKICSAAGCTNQVVNGGVCRRHGAKVKLCSNAVMKGVQMVRLWEECALGMGQNRNDAALKDAPVKSSTEEYASKVKQCGAL